MNALAILWAFGLLSPNSGYIQGSTLYVPNHAPIQHVIDAQSCSLYRVAVDVQLLAPEVLEGCPAHTAPDANWKRDLLFVALPDQDYADAPQSTVDTAVAQLLASVPHVAPRAPVVPSHQVTTTRPPTSPVAVAPVATAPALAIDSAVRERMLDRNL